MSRPARRTLQRYAEPFTYDPNPLYACEVVYTADGIGEVKSWVAFDPKYGPETQQQIDHHLDAGTPGAELWEPDTPAAPYA